MKICGVMEVMCRTTPSQLGLFLSQSVFISAHHSCWCIRPRCLARTWYLAHGFFFFHSFSDIVLLFLQHARRVPSSQPRVQVCVYSALLTAAPQLRLPPSVCAATATTAAMLISRMNPAPVSISYMTLHTRSNTVTHLHSCRCSCNRHVHVCMIHFTVNVYVTSILNILVMHVSHYIFITTV